MGRTNILEPWWSFGKDHRTIPSSLPELAEVHSEVEREYHTQRRQQQKDIAYQKMLEGYEVVIEPAATSNSDNKSVTSLNVKDASK